MGLSATQARMLFITSRQTDVSSNMQRISNQKMVLARDTEDVSSTYARMLDAKKITTNNNIELNYDNLMGNTAINNIGQVNLITNHDGKVVLNSSDANKYGLPANIGSKGDLAIKYPTIKEFIEHIESKDIAAKMNAVLNGSTIRENLSSEEISKIDDYMKTNGGYPTNVKELTINNFVNSMTMGSVKAYGGEDWVSNKFNGILMSQILSGQACTSVEIACDGDRRGVPSGQAQKNIGAVANMFKDVLLKSLGMDANSAVGKALTNYVTDLKAKTGSWNAKMKEVLKDGAGGTLGEVASTWATSTRGRADNDHMKINAQVLFQRMIFIALSKIQDNFSGGSFKNLSDITNNKHDKFTISTNEKGKTLNEWMAGLKNLVGEPKVNDAVNYCKNGLPSESDIASFKAKAECYKTIYENIKNHGWIVDNASITEKLINGTYNLNGSQLTKNDYKEISDDEIKAKAEAYYNTEMAKINRKEKKLDMDMNKLQTEYDSLTSDLNSVQSIIQSNIDRSFTFFQA